MSDSPSSSSSSKKGILSLILLIVGIVFVVIAIVISLVAALMKIKSGEADLSWIVNVTHYFALGQLLTVDGKVSWYLWGVVILWAILGSVAGALGWFFGRKN